MTSFAGRTVLVTGAASGIGRLMALESAQRGATVVGWDVHADPLDVLVKEVGDQGGVAHGYVCDVGDRDQVLATGDLVRREVGPVDVLVNNAGIVAGKYFLDLTEDDIERTFRVNTLAHFWTLQAFLPQMIERGTGHVVTISSAAGLGSFARLSAYCASKAAVLGLTESLRLELARTAPGVRTTLVCPNVIDTGMFAGASPRMPWLTPVLHAPEVATAVIRAVEADQERLYIPRLVYFAAALRGVPARLADGILNRLGATAGMDQFVGRRR